jgi:hypothetical protein
MFGLCSAKAQADWEQADLQIPDGETESEATSVRFAAPGSEL